MKSALEIRELRKRFGPRRALDGLDLDVAYGCIMGLVGANGAGKTTLLSICAGFLRPDAGAVNVLGSGLFDPRRHSGRVALLPQEAQLPSGAVAADLLAYYGRLQGLSCEDIGGRVREVLDHVNLVDHARCAVKSLSHGMARRLALAQALLGRPELLLLDEPLNGLDPRETARVRELLLQQRGKRTVLISSHQLLELESVCDTVAFIADGRRIRQDRLEDVLRDRRQVTYRVGAGSIQLPQLRAAFPGATWSLSPGGDELSASAEHDLSGLNAAVLSYLLHAGVEILEIRRGSGLEREFLEATKTRMKNGNQTGGHSDE